MSLSLWSALSIQICSINVLYLIIGTLLFICGLTNCSRNKKASATKESSEPKKAVVEHSIRLSFHNELPRSEASSSPKTTLKHRPGSVFQVPDQTQSGVIHSKDLLLSKHMPKLSRETQSTTVRKPVIESEKLFVDKTQISTPSIDLTQSVTTSEEYDDKQISRTLTESTKEDSKPNKTKEIFSNLGRREASETSISNVVINQGSVAAQRQTEVEESESTTI